MILWVLGEYGSLADIGPAGVLRALSTLAEEHTLSDPVRGYLLTAMAKLAVQVSRCVQNVFSLACAATYGCNLRLFCDTASKSAQASQSHAPGFCCLQGNVALPPAAEQAVEDAAASRNTDLQQRALELQALLRCTGLAPELHHRSCKITLADADGTQH